MPSKDRDAELDSAIHKQQRSRSERKPEKDRDHRQHRSSRSSRSKVGDDAAETQSYVSVKRLRKKDKDKGEEEPRERSASTNDLTADLSNMSMNKQRISLPYPSFSKAHSKEAVHSRDDVSTKRPSNPPTPEPTDYGADDHRSKSAGPSRKSSTSKKSARPPTPPETEVSADKRRAQQGRGVEGVDRCKSTSSSNSKSASRNDDGSRVSRKSASSSQATYIKSPKHKSHEKLRSSTSVRPTSSRHTTKRSGSTRSPRGHDAADDESSPSSAQDSSPKTPTPTSQFPPPNVRSTSPHVEGEEAKLPSKTATPAPIAAPQPPPPPPPPPAVDVQDIPRVDYLLQNGGLPYPVPRRFLSALPSSSGVRQSNQRLAGAETLFAPFFNLLDQYSSVLSRHGSIAVATGHRSVARRLLDRLENVFSRDLPPNGCTCAMCDRSHEIHRGLTWGDVLEWVSGRIELPEWPPFDLAEIGAKAAEISAEVPPRPASPVKMDPDIAEEFREHYMRQSKKVRSAVDKWLNQTGETPAPPPQDVDDETLAFAILTNLEPEDRPYFNALLSGTRDLKPSTRAPTPGSGQRSRNDFIIKCGLSLQRLYRLSQVPRDAESATYLVKNPQTHDLLVTISNINGSEWEILTSGRFDGFLWSGADVDDYAPGTEPRGETPVGGHGGHRASMSPGPRGTSTTGSRHATPFSPYSRGPTPASFVSLASSGMMGGRHPVSNDEEMEMAAAAEIEREIYAGMETLEDAFEKLHHKAEMVRTALRQRGAGLMQSFQNRRRIDVLPTPGSGNSHHAAYERPAWAVGSEGEGGSDDEWGLDDVDIMPDDSASNISSSRHRRPKRRTERRTPAPIEEDEEER
ncbi:hypothetical protein CDD83_4330 [Cordyceps sp. RAO-2017]|nr:hypothetical protein CDD83_4330 [Cordyceps sp. RAO-2017]